MPHNSLVTDKLDTGRPITARHAMAPPTDLPRVELPTVLVFQDVASLVDSFLAYGAVDPNSCAQTALDQAIVPTSAPSHGVGLNGSTQAPPYGGQPNGGHRGHAEETTAYGSALGAAGVANPDYAAAPPTGLTPVPAPTPAVAPLGPSPWALDQTPSPVETVAPVETAVPAETVTDEERTSYGLLLDRAAERGLLDSAEYEVRLRQLAEATTTAQMVAIVAELPAFAAQATPSAPRQSRSAIQSASRSAQAGDRPKRRVVIWVLMGVLVALALVSLVILALSVGRLSRSRSSLPPAPPAATRPVSALRL